MLRAIVILAVLTSCRVHRTFECAMDADCGGPARCESATHFCSFPDPDCSSGFRYDDYAGDGLANDCVTSTGGDVPGCPADYVRVGPLASGYRFVTQPATWLAAEQDCENDGGSTHLVIVDANQENDRMERDVAGATRFWMGITDRITEGAYKTVTNQTQTYLPWKDNEPDGTDEDCLYNEETDFFDDDCNQVRAYICECDGVAPVAGSY